MLSSFRAVETTIDEMLKPTIYELKEDLKDLTRNFILITVMQKLIQI